MPEILKSRCIHAHVKFVFGFCNILFSCKKQTKGLEVNLTAIIQLDEFNFSPEACMVNVTLVRENIARFAQLPGTVSTLFTGARRLDRLFSLSFLCYSFSPVLFINILPAPKVYIYTR